MSENMFSSKPIKNIPTNIITGFLGSGKTTTILNLLKRKPADERWAVLVNEFGDIGIDGALIKGASQASEGVFVKEVPGGCMCCTAGLPMQIALNLLLREAKPDRLLIEPTGLGHPKEVIEALKAEHYKGVLNIQQCLTLVDPRNIANERYTKHETFNQQIEVADVIVGHKADLCSLQDKENLKEYVAKKRGESVRVIFAEYGDINPLLLKGESAVFKFIKPHSHHHSHDSNIQFETPEFPPCGYLRSENSGEGYKSVGWRFAPEIIFSRSKLFAWLSGLKVERAKAVFITQDGIFAYNITDGSMTEFELDECEESRIEIISKVLQDDYQTDLFKCMANSAV